MIPDHSDIGNRQCEASSIATPREHSTTAREVIDVNDDVDDNDQDRDDQDDQDVPVPPHTKKTKQPRRNAARTPDETARIRLGGEMHWCERVLTLAIGTETFIKLSEEQINILETIYTPELVALRTKEAKNRTPPSPPTNEPT